MAGPWEKYQSAPAATAGPWTKYQSAAPTPEPPAADSYAPPATVPVRDPMDPYAPPVAAEPTYVQPAERQMTGREALQAISQGGLRGMADVGGAVVDIPVGLLNLGAMGANAAAQGLNDFTGTEGDAAQIPMIDFSLSDTIANTASELAPMFGLPAPLTREEMGPAGDVFYSPARFGAGAAVGGGVLSNVAKRTAREVAPIADKTMADSLLAPYRAAPNMTVARDAAAGTGAGVGSDLAPDEGAGAFLGPLLGAFAGSSAFGAGLSAAKGADTLFRNLTTPTKVFDGQEFSPGVIEQVTRRMQSAARDPLTGEDRAADAAATIRQQGDYFKDAGLPVPDAGLLSPDNIGLQDLGHYLRVNNKLPFMQNDQNMKNAVSERVGSLRDPGADMDAVGASIDASERSYRMSRDAEALPLLRQAEQSGVTVDASPVADLIDQKLMTVKRPPVRKALAEARAFLNETGGDNLDTSVSGLYEARKAINDVIEGRGDNPTGRFAQGELIEVRNALDEAITQAAPEFGQYLQKFREGSAPLDDYGRGTVAETVRNARDIRQVVEKTLNDVWGGKATIDDIKSLISGDPEADRALAAAVSDVLSRRVTRAVKTPGGDPEVSAASLSKTMKENEDLLAEVYTPEQMNTLRQGQALLETLQNIPKGAVAGSNTTEKMMAALTGPTMEAALKARYGVLKGGGILRTLRVVVESLPNNQKSVDDLLRRAYFNPEIAEYLLTGAVRDWPRGESNKRLRMALAGYVASAEGDNAPEEE